MITLFFTTIKKKLTSKIHSLVRYSENRDRYDFTTEFLHTSIFKINTLWPNLNFLNKKQKLPNFKYPCSFIFIYSVLQCFTFTFRKCVSISNRKLQTVHFYIKVGWEMHSAYQAFALQVLRTLVHTWVPMWTLSTAAWVWNPNTGEKAPCLSFLTSWIDETQA